MLRYSYSYRICTLNSEQRIMKWATVNAGNGEREFAQKAAQACRDDTIARGNLVHKHHQGWLGAHGNLVHNNGLRVSPTVWSREFDLPSLWHATSQSKIMNLSEYGQGYYVDWKQIIYTRDTNLVAQQCNGKLRKPAPPNGHFETLLRAAWAIQGIDFTCKETTVSVVLQWRCRDLTFCYCLDAANKAFYACIYVSEPHTSELNRDFSYRD